MLKSKFSRSFLAQNRPKLLISLGAVCIVIIVGLFFAFSRAATSFISLEAENGNTSGNVSKVDDTTASNGQAIAFGTAPETGGGDGDDTPPVAENALYVATTGNDSAAGNEGAPLKTLAKASTVAKAGQTVYLRAGTYSTINTAINSSGTAGNVITYSAYPGEKVVLDATGGTLASDGSMVDIKGSYVTFTGFELQNSTGRGITTTGTGNLISKNIFHDMKYNGLIDAGTNNTIDSNEVYNTVMSNENDALGTGGWAEALNTFKSTNTTFSNNYVHDNWGEGIDFIQSTGGKVTNNKLVDNYSVHVYVDGTEGVTVTGNHIANTSTKYDRTGGLKTFGILFADESGSKGGKLSNEIATGNFIYDTRGITTWNVTLQNSDITTGNTTCTTQACAIN